ncbi:MAG TPA: hypothetical protein VH062_29550 [Polyangiaceae bacterium]|jgi:hypothetical protein|nr:hypothetical protein [Polyangiaceae bacterium]
MFVARTLTRFGLLVALVAPIPFVAACGGSAPPAKVLPKAGDMPEGAEWTGVYFSPTYGNLHMVKEGSAISGKWRNAAGDKWGALHGEVTGNLLHYEWEETTIGMVGPSAKKTGRGYFQYIRPPGDLVNDEVRGEWGLGQQTTGVTWTAVKQRNAKPDLDSVVPDETQKIDNGAGWDESKKKPGGGGDDKKSDDWN